MMDKKEIEKLAFLAVRRETMKAARKSSFESLGLRVV